MIRYIFVIFYFLVISDGAYEGDGCIKGGVKGTCTLIQKCPSAIEDLQKKINPQICTFAGTDPVVCCVSKTTAPLPTEAPRTPAPQPVATPAPLPTQTTTEYIPEVNDYETINKVGACEDISLNMTAPRTGQKAWDKCIEYQETLVYPCEASVTLTGELGRGNHCHHTADYLIVGGANAGLGEFPHMALLGFGDDRESAQWLCGGTLLSERFILTAGHCTSTREYGPVTFATLGSLKRSDKDSSRVYRIKRIIKHPEYKPPVKYNDIALLETETTMKLDQYAVPACLDIGKEKTYVNASATGWGTTAYKGDTADHLQKVTLMKFSDAECSQKFPESRLMKQGFDVNTQICYGDYTQSKDTCQGDSGGPLQVKNTHIDCMYTVVGVTSFGRACGYAGEPGIYTKVSAYVPWIESIVWA